MSMVAVALVLAAQQAGLPARRAITEMDRFRFVAEGRERPGVVARAVRCELMRPARGGP